METTKELRSELKSILNIYINAKLFFQDAEYLYSPDTVEEKVVANNNSFIIRTRISAWRSAILELCKLFQKSKNEHYNLITFLDNILFDYCLIEWKQKIPKKNILSFLNEMKTPEIKIIRNNLKILRDTEIAHTDKNREVENEKIKITFTEIKILLNLTEQIILEMKKGYLDTLQEFDLPETEKAGNILTIIDNYEKEKKEKVIPYWIKPNT